MTSSGSASAKSFRNGDFASLLGEPRYPSNGAYLVTRGVSGPALVSHSEGILKIRVAGSESAMALTLPRAQSRREDSDARSLSLSSTTAPTATSRADAQGPLEISNGLNLGGRYGNHHQCHRQFSSNLRLTG